jgi:hypothetical protein
MKATRFLKRKFRHAFSLMKVSPSTMPSIPEETTNFNDLPKDLRKALSDKAANCK